MEEGARRGGGAQALSSMQCLGGDVAVGIHVKIEEHEKHEEEGEEGEEEHEGALGGAHIRRRVRRVRRSAREH